MATPTPIPALAPGESPVDEDEDEDEEEPPAPTAVAVANADDFDVEPSMLDVESPEPSVMPDPDVVVKARPGAPAVVAELEAVVNSVAYKTWVKLAIQKLIGRAVFINREIALPDCR